MALQRQNITAPLGVGLDTKTEGKQLAIGKLSVLENGVFTKIKNIQKRFGLSPLVSSIITGGNITSGKQVSSLGQELLEADGSNLYAYSPGANNWVVRGALQGASVQSFGLARGYETDLTATDSATANGFTVTAWEADGSATFNQGIFASVIDAATNTVIVPPTQISATGFKPRCSTAFGKFFVHLLDIVGTNFIFVCEVSATAPILFSARTAVANNVNASFSFGVCQSGAANVVLSYATAGGGLKLGFLQANGTFAVAPVPVTHADTPSCMGLISYSNADPLNDAIYLVYQIGGAGNLFALIYNLTLSNAPAPVAIANAVARGQIGLVQMTSSLIQIYTSGLGGFGGLNDIRTASITRAGVTTGATIYLNNIGLYSKPTLINGVPVMVGVFPGAGNLQAGYFVLSGTLSGQVVNRISYLSGGKDLTQVDTLSSLLLEPNGKYLFSNQSKTGVKGENGVLFSELGIQISLINFSDPNLWQDADLGRQKYIAAGMLNQYDGQSLVETGFNVYPDGYTAMAGAPGPALPAGIRRYVVIYEWTNQNGDIERSNFGVPLLFDTTGGADLASVTINAIPYLNLTKKRNVVIAIYRTKKDGQTYYKSGTILNDPFGLTVSYADFVSDTAIGSHEVLYTTGGIIENNPPMSCTSITEYRDRIVAVGLEDQNAIWYSKQYVQGSLPAFNAAFSMRIDQGRLGITACGTLDEKLVIFKENQIFITAGDGPLATGAQNDFLNPINDASDVGCPSPRSVVQTPLGLMFKSKKGYYILDRSLQMGYIGAEVEDFNSLNVTSATLLDQVNQVRFTHSDGSCLVYDYYFKQWGVLTNYLAVGACNWNGTYVLARANGTVNKESTVSYLDNGAAISTHITTPWIQTAGIEGFQRIYEAVLLGDKKSNHTITIKVGYDFDPTWAETFVFDMSAVLSPIDELKIRPAQQKCTAIRFDVADSNPGLVDGAGVSFSALTLSVGVKGGTQRVPAARTVQSS